MNQSLAFLFFLFATVLFTVVYFCLMQKPVLDIGGTSDTPVEKLPNVTVNTDHTTIAGTGTPGKAYTTEPIRKLDDYEYSQVFNDEGSLENTSEAALNYAMSRYPLDWSTKPPSDHDFQIKREAFIDASHKQSDMASNKSHPIYNSLEGKNIVPRDKERLEMEERKILQTYVPEKSADLLTYSMDDVHSLVDKLYDAKGLIPTLQKSSQGDNIYEVVEVFDKDKPIIWEDDQELTNVKRSKLRGEMQITVPPTARDHAASMDPFYEPRTSLRSNKNDYTKWTPDLQRQFAPTYPAKNWY